jgi:hypothetical protein
MRVCGEIVLNLSVPQWLALVGLATFFTCDASDTALAQSLKIRTTTYDGVPLEEPILVRTRGVLLSIPVGYLAPWPKPDARGREIGTDKLNFNFWMPDRRHVEIADPSLVGFRPREPGRSKPNSNAYVVRVRLLQTTELQEPEYLPPEKLFENATRPLGLSSYTFSEEPFGLVRFWLRDGHLPRAEPFINYRHVDGSDPQLLLRCLPESARVANPSCTGDVYIAADKLAFFLHFSRSDLPYWREIVFAVRDLFDSWRVRESKSSP